MIQRRQLTLVGRGGQDDGKVKDLTKSRVGESLVAVEGRVKVPSDLVETFLDVDNEEELDNVRSSLLEQLGVAYSIVLVKALVLEGVLGDLVGEDSSSHQANAEERGNLHLGS